MQFGTTWATATEAVDLLAEISLEIEECEQPTRRAEPRFPVSVPVRVEPLNDNLNTIGVTIDGVTRDISKSGIGLFHADPMDHNFVQLTVNNLKGREVVVIGQIRHSHKVGAFHHTGIEFLYDQK